jgi:hypothetical protein
MQPSATLAVAAATAALSAAGGYAVGVMRATGAAPADPALSTAAGSRGPLKLYLESPPLVLPPAVPRKRIKRRTVVVPAPRPAPAPVVVRPVNRMASATTSPSGHGGEKDDGGGGGGSD